MPESSSHITKEELVAENLRLKAELAELKRLIFGRKSERFVPDQAAASAGQLNLFVQHEHEGSEEKTVLQAVEAHSRKKARSLLAQHLCSLQKHQQGGLEPAPVS